MCTGVCDKLCFTMSNYGCDCVYIIYYISPADLKEMTVQHQSYYTGEDVGKLWSQTREMSFIKYCIVRLRGWVGERERWCTIQLFVK